MSTKIYRNTTSKTVNVLGVGEIEGGSQVSLTTEYQPAIILENYPGIIEVSDEVSTKAATATQPKTEEQI